MKQNQETTQVQAENNQQSERRPYQKPSVVSESLFETVAQDNSKNTFIGQIGCDVHSDS